jgi:hypothetical protein
MKVNVGMAIMSHLSDAQELIGLGLGKDACDEINYAKRILMHYRQNINQEAEEDELTNVCLG